MLESDYPTKFGELIQTVSWDIELPIEWATYFQERGEVPCYADDERNNQRLKVRAHGLMHFDVSLPFRPRGSGPVGVYTRDFSRHGCGLLTPVELYPLEKIRIALPTFWVQLEVVRARRITSKCFEIGTVLIKRHNPSIDGLMSVEAADAARSVRDRV